MNDEPLILVTNDDGIDSVGLHVLARAMVGLGRVMVVAPDSEYSGAGAAIGAIWENTPEVHEATIDGIKTAYSVSGAPALCVLYSRLGAFGPVPDLVVSGINPGVNVGRSVYHSGTVGAALTGRNGGISGIAVSQAVPSFGTEGQGWGDVVAEIRWGVAAGMARAAASAMLAADNRGAGARVLNINVPILESDTMPEWRWTEVGESPPRAMTTVDLRPKPGHKGTFSVNFSVGDTLEHPPGTDTRSIIDGVASLTWLGRLSAEPFDPSAVDARLASAKPHPT